MSAFFRSLLASVFLCVLCGESVAVDLYVARTGNDGWSGRKPAAEGGDGPFATLERARDEARRLRKAGDWRGATVHVRAGTYPLGRTLQLTKEDSGTKEHPVVWRGYENERPRLLGGRFITGFVKDRGAVMKASLKGQGFDGVTFRQLFYQGVRQPLARYPNHDASNPYHGGWAYADGKPVPMYLDRPDDNRRAFTVREADARRWADPTEGEVFVFARYNWWNNVLRIQGYDPAARRLTLAGDASYAIRPGDRYYVQGLREELDAPGEWYLDRATATLHFWPPGPLGDEAVYAPTVPTILDLAPGTEHVTVRGFTLECSAGTAVVLRGTNDCVLAGNVIRNVGDYHGSGVSVDGGRRNTVVGNDIAHTGSHGVALSGGERTTLTPAENAADNNYIHHVGVFYKQGVGVMLNGVGNRATRNLIHDGPRMGIMFSGNNLLIEGNHIRHVNLETEDTGAVYTGGRDWISSRGTVIRHNYFHDILGFGQHDGKWTFPYFAWGVYLDDNAGGVDVIGNIVARCSRAGLHLHNGRDNHIENNVFVDHGLAQVEYGGWTDTHSYWKDHLPSMIKGYESVIGNPAWQRMRHMELHPTKAVLPDHTIMAGNRFRRNVVSYTGADARLFQVHSYSFTANESDGNLFYHHGLPLRTGQVRYGPDTGGELAPNPRLIAKTPGQLPDGWQWQIRPGGKATALTVPVGGRSVLRINGAEATDRRGKPEHPIVVSRDVPATPGQAFRLKVRLRASKPDAKVQVMAQSYVAGAYFWGSSYQAHRVGTSARTIEHTFRLPAKGERGHHDQMAAIRVRFDFNEPDGSLFVESVSLHRCTALDEWASWQAAGHDRKSIVADPLFVDPKHDDYRLKPDSPAFKLGFEPIPVEKIGPYESPLRASWPIVEATGIREVLAGKR
ncbi:MAG: right-handed parallel beta-helix repeat-containing protein [Gemmataceae bacterium]